jgi:hypothetical protein
MQESFGQLGRALCLIRWGASREGGGDRAHAPWLGGGLPKDVRCQPQVVAGARNSPGPSFCAELRWGAMARPQPPHTSPQGVAEATDALIHLPMEDPGSSSYFAAPH